MTKVITKYKVTVIESEAGWGQSCDREYYDTEEKAKARVFHINSKNTSTTVPDWYMSADYDGKVEGIEVEENGRTIFRELR